MDRRAMGEAAGGALEMISRAGILKAPVRDP
jgi:hypothetical protein